jgi:hypothetical protein
MSVMRRLGIGGKAAVDRFSIEIAPFGPSTTITHESDIDSAVPRPSIGRCV